MQKFILKGFLLLIIFLLVANILFSEEKKEKFVYDAQNKRDPFIPLVTNEGFLISLESEKEFEDITLEGIIYDEKGTSYAIINSNIVKAGDNIGAITIMEIRKDKVLILKEGQILAIELAKEEE